MEKASEWLNSFNSSYEGQFTELTSSSTKTVSKAQKISVTGGKGGVGKTSISLKMSLEMAALGNKVLLIDCDYNLSNTAIKLGLPIDNTFYSLVSAEKTFEECLYKDGSFHLLSACNGSLELFDTNFRLEQLIVDIISSHEQDYDYIFLDCPAGLSRETLTLNAYCDHRVMIVTPDQASITDSYSLIKVLNKKFGISENHLVVNMLNNKQQYSRVVKTLSETIENYLGCRTKVLGGIKKLDTLAGQFDKHFLEAGKNGHHLNFLKVVKRFADEIGRKSIVELIPTHLNELKEQEVH
ncbi:MAG: AAA family ATPase [Flavobacteriaceae bacterium]|nr:AAA family ATPase [Flavobacteriaceae bacterium]